MRIKSACIKSIAHKKCIFDKVVFANSIYSRSGVFNDCFIERDQNTFAEISSFKSIDNQTICFARKLMTKQVIIQDVCVEHMWKITNYLKDIFILVEKSKKMALLSLTILNIYANS